MDQEQHAGRDGTRVTVAQMPAAKFAATGWGRGTLTWLRTGAIPAVVARLAVGGVVGYMATMKLADPILFLKLTRQYGVLPTQPPYYLNLTAIVVPYLELICAVAIVFGLLRRGAALLIAGMLLFFTPMLAIHANYLLHHPDVTGGKVFHSFCEVAFDCGCGTGVTFMCPKLAENIALLGGAVLVLVSASSRFSLDGLLWRRHARSARRLACRTHAPVT
jgi:uncharacterized membrane protein YphA (DoxX/SURF4 family)